MVKKIFLILLLVFYFLFISCYDGAYIEGDIQVLTPGKDVRRLKSLNGSFSTIYDDRTTFGNEAGETIDASLSQGHFRFKVPAEDCILLSMLYIGSGEYPSWVSPEVSIWEKKPICLEKGEVYALDLYVSDLIELESPQINSVFHQDSNILFRWEENMGADCYYLSLKKELEDKSRETKIAVVCITDEEISMNEIRSLPQVDVFYMEDVMALRTLTYKYSSLEPGIYHISLTAFRLEKDNPYAPHGLVHLADNNELRDIFIVEK